MNSPRYLAIALFLFLLAIYLLTYTPRINASDGLAMFATAESIIRRGALDIEQIRWLGLQQGTYGLDGLLYSRKGIGVPIGLLPLTGLGFLVPQFGLVSTSLLFNALVTALTAVLLLAYLQRLGVQWRTGLLVSLTFGLATLAWPYAKSLFSDPFSGLMLLSAAYCLTVYRPTDQSATGLRWPFLAGLCLAWNVAARYAEAVFIPVFSLWLLYKIRPGVEDETFRVKRSPGTPLKGWMPIILKPIVAFCLPLLVVGSLLLIFNVSRYGNPLNTGYLPNETFSGSLWQGVSGQLISPGRGLLVYCPVLILSFVGVVGLWRSRQTETLVATSIILIHLLLYGKWFMWHGGYAWGPRFLIPTLPFWAIFLAPIIEPLWLGRRLTFRERFGLSAYFILTTLSLIPQWLTVTIDFAPFQNALLDTGRPLFDPATFFQWQYSPLVAGWSFITRQNLDLVWAWHGQINGPLVSGLVINLLVAIYFLLKTVKESATPQLAILTSLTSIIVTFFLLSQAHGLPADSVKQAVARLNGDSQPTDAIILNNPDLTMPFAERYTGRASVLGLNVGGPSLPAEIDRRLADTLATHEQIWWLPNWLPPAESSLEQRLLAQGFRVEEQRFADQRLVLFAFPNQLPQQPRPPEAIFESRLILTGLAYRPQSQPGQAFPLELAWQIEQPLRQDYHLFVHLLDNLGNLVSQTDGQPVNWTRPTSTWAIGEPIIDRQALWIPSATPAGTYRLRLGWYHPKTGQRLQLPSGADALEFIVRLSI